MTLQEANHLGSGDRLVVMDAGLNRHGVGAEDGSGVYVSQFESQKNGRMVIVRLDIGETYGFRLDEVELLGP